ncbi:MAG: cytochrome P450 [Kibdelosporangium sp.]
MPVQPPSPPPGCPAHQERVPIYGPDFAEDPERVYQRLRAMGPVAPVELAPGIPASLVLSYDAVMEVMRSPDVFPRDPRPWQHTVPQDSPILPLMAYRPNTMYSDGPQHTRVRTVVNDSLARVPIDELRLEVEKITGLLITQFGGIGHADLIDDYALAVPVLTFNWMFGCPPNFTERLIKGMKGIFDGIDPHRANAELTRTIGELLDLKRRRPGADLVTWLLTHPVGLTDQELTDEMTVLFGAGIEPQRNLIANGLRRLLSDDGFADNVTSGNVLVDQALDEVLWKDPPMANFSASYPVQDVTLAGVPLPAAQPVVMSYAAANADPALAGVQRVGNRAHLAWGVGPHTCPAQAQARLIASVAIERLLDSLPDMRLAVPADELKWRPGPFHRALASLPVRFTPIATPCPADHMSGDSRWTASAPTSSTPQAATSTASSPDSPGKGQPAWWRSLVEWWRGR